MLSVSVQFGCCRSLIGVKNAFVNAPLKKDSYIAQLYGFEAEGREDHVYDLKKALYELKQGSSE